MITLDASILRLCFLYIEILPSPAKLFTKLLRLQFPLGDIFALLLWRLSRNYSLLWLYFLAQLRVLRESLLVERPTTRFALYQICNYLAN